MKDYFNKIDLTKLDKVNNELSQASLERLSENYFKNRFKTYIAAIIFESSFDFCKVRNILQNLLKDSSTVDAYLFLDRKVAPVFIKSENIMNLLVNKLYGPIFRCKNRLNKPRFKNFEEEYYYYQNNIVEDILTPEIVSIYSERQNIYTLREYKRNYRTVPIYNNIKMLLHCYRNSYGNNIKYDSLVFSC